MTQNKNKILLIYPSLFKITGLPLGIASLSSVLKRGGYDVKVFDTAFYDLNTNREWDKLRSDRLMSKKIINEDEHWIVKTNDPKDDLIQLIQEYKPKVIGISLLESNYERGLMLTRPIKQRYPDIIIAAGGVFPTLSPDTVIKEDSIDIICLGEGETAFLELCDRVCNGKNFYDIEGLWTKEEKKIHKNKPAKLHNLDDLPYPDFTVFEKALFYKPMQGRLYKMVSIETSRGCPYHCTYCAAPQLKGFFANNSLGHYYRNMKMEKIIEQIHYQIEKHSPEFIYFSSETFLAMGKQDFDMFAEEYKKIGLPFWFQTRFETITEDRIEALKKIGMFWLTLGVEHGNEQFRKNILKRNYSDKSVIQAVSVLNKYGMGASLNNIMGLPLENRELIFDTIKLNKQLFEINNRLEFNIFMFVPFKGCELYDLCKEKGLLPEKISSPMNDLSDESTLNFPAGYKQELKGLMKTFNLYIKLPEKYWPEIKIAEKSDEEGQAAFQRLSQLLEK